MHGAWIFAATSAVALLSKYVITFRGRHVFNPSNFGLVPCFLLLGPEQADPLEFWWGPLSPALVVALALIVLGGLAILGRLHLTEVAVGFWLAFSAGIGVLAASGHEMTAAWHVGPIEGLDFWWTLVSSPEILVFLFFMITDPRTIPETRAGRRAYAVGVGLLATLFIAPYTTEFAAKVAVVGALFLVCAARPALLLFSSTRIASRARGLVPATYFGARGRRLATGGLALGGAVAFAGLVVAAGIPARPEAAAGTSAAGTRLPAVSVASAEGVAALDRGTRSVIARDLVADLRDEAKALGRRDRDLAAAAATGSWLAELWERIAAGRSPRTRVPAYDARSVRLRLEPGDDQGPPTIVALVKGEVVMTSVGPTGATQSRGEPRPFTRTVELTLERGRYRIARSRGGVPLSLTGHSPTRAGNALGGVRLEDVAAEVGLDFRHAAFRFGVSDDETAMMGGGLCWLDYDGDGWLDLFVVNGYAESDLLPFERRGGLPRSALFRNVKGRRFEDVTRESAAGLPLRGSGCVAADLDLDGDADLYVTTAGYNVATDGYDALLWNDGDGTFTEGAREAGINAFGWHAGAAVGDLNGDGRPDLVVAGYTDVNRPIPQSTAGFPTNHAGMRDLLYLNVGADAKGHARFREVGRQVGLESRRAEHGLGVVLTDVDRDGRLDVYVANDSDPNRLYLNVPHGGALGLRLREVGRRAGVDDPNAGMGIAAADVSGDGRIDLLVTNARGQLHGAFRSRPARVRAPGRWFEDARPTFAPAFGTASTGWGVSWVDLDLDADLDVAVANGAIPVVDLEHDAERVQVLENLGGERFASVGDAIGLRGVGRVNGRGLAAADYDNDGDLDLAVSSIGGRLMLLRTSGAEGHWLEVRLPTFAPGARLTAVLPDGRELVREAQAGSSYLSSEDPRVHFGLGRASDVRELRVRFPDGRMTRLRNIPADRLVEVRRSGD
jgi:hypothetical protein